MSKLTPEQIKQAQGIANTRAKVISELVAMDGVPVDACTASALAILCIWTWQRVGWDTPKVVKFFRDYANNLEAREK